MTTQGSAPQGGDSTWSGLVTLEPQLRAAAIRERFEQVLALPDAEMHVPLTDRRVGMRVALLEGGRSRRPWFPRMCRLCGGVL